MPSKLQTYMQMADEAQRQITGSYRGWTGFLTTAARLYKYPYAEQVMIHAQRPDATACAEYDFWNEKMGRYVRRGSKGIALIDSSGERPRLRYVFDVSDTGGREFPKSRYLWEYREEHADAVSAMLESRYGVDGKGGLPDQLERIASQLAEEYWRDYKRDILAIVDDSFLYGYDEFNVGAAFQSAAAVSIAYSLMSRCGLEADDRFEHEDFLSIFDFNTPEAAAELGTAVSRINGEVLRQIEVTIKNYEREKLAERSHSHDRADLHQERGLPDSRPDAERNAGGRETPGQVRETAQELSSGAQTGAVQPSGAVGEAVPAPAGDRRDGEPEAGADDAGADEVGGRDGGAESPRPDEMGGADEQPESAGGGDHPQRAGVQLTNDAPEAEPAQPPIPQAYQLSLFPTEEEQIAYIAEAESYTPSAFSMSIPQADIDHILRMEGNADYARMKIATEFSKGKSVEEIAAFLQSSFHGGNGVVTENGRYSAWYADDGIHIANGDAARHLTSAKVVSWQEAAERIGQLLTQGEYAANVELAEAPGHERAELAQSIWYLRQDLSEKARAQGYLSCLSDMRGGGFPEETARLAERLTDPAFREVLMDDFSQLRSDYREDRSLLRFHYHKPDKIEQGLRELSLPRREYRTEMAEIPAVQRFITEDEIAATLTRGSNIEGSKGRIYAYFKEKHSPREQADFLKDEYGIGGRSHAVSGASHSGEDHSGKGVVLKKQDCPEIQLNWANVAKRISELIRKDRFLTPEEKTQYKQLQRQTAERSAAWNDYNAVKEAHPDNLVLFQVGDFFEMYGEDAKQAAELLNMNLTTRNIPGAGRVEMCGVPSHNLEMYVEKLRDKYDVTIAAAPDFRGERHIYTLRSIDHEAEAAINAYEAEFGADGTRVFRDPAAEQVQPTVQELFERYRLSVGNALSKDEAFLNACRNSDRQNAYLEGAAAIRRIVTESGDLQLTRLYFDMPAFHNRLHQELLDELYPTLATTVTPSPYKVTQADIDAALQQWNGRIESKHAVVRYMKAHARDRDTAAWLAREYGLKDTSKPLQISVGNSEPVTLSWAKVQRRIAQLIQSDGFYTEQEQDNFDNIDPIAIREALAERGIVNGQIVDAEANRNSPFVRQVMADVERIAAQERKAQQEEPAFDPADRFHVVSLDRGFRTLYAVWDDETHGYHVDADGVTEEFTSEWQAEAYRLELQGQAEQALLERAKGLISDFCRSEYGSEADFSDPAKVGVAYTTVTDDEIPIQVNIDLVNFRLERYLDDEHLETRQYGSLQELISNELENLDFSDLIHVSDEDVDQYLWREPEEAVAEAPETAPAPQREPFTYSVGDTVYLENGKPYIIESVGVFDITLSDPTLFYPISRAESRESFARLMERYPQPEKTAAENTAVPEKEPKPAYTEETVAVYPGDKNNLPYDVEIRTLRFDEPEPPSFEEVVDANPISVQVGGEWQTFPNREAAEKAMYEEYKDNLRRNAENFRITDDELGIGGAKAKFRANMAAIHLLKELEFEGLQASPEQQEILSRYVGWGGLADAFDESKDNWKAEFAELYAALSPEEYAAARASTLNAHYTSPTVIRAIYDAVENMGFQTGNILEPSMGVGNFFGMLPESMKSSRLYGVELDSITGRIAKQLYPKADITVAGFETTDRKDFFDLAVGNVPFGQYQVSDRAFDKLGFSIHNYFFAKALDQVRPGGVVAFVTSRYTMDAKDSAARKYIAQRADFLGAIRLPNNAFRANAGTDVVSDIIFLQKRDRPIEIEPDWVHLGANADGFAINQYFIDHPEMVLGRQTSESTQYGRQDFTVAPIEGADLAEQLSGAIRNIRGTYAEAELPDLGEDETIVETIPADPNVRNFSYTVVDGELYYRQNSIMTKPDFNATAKERAKGMVELRDCVQKLISQQMDGFISDDTIRQTQAELNTLYDGFTAKYGLINSRANALAFAEDSSYYLLCSLEELDEDKNLKRKADMFTRRTIRAHEAVTSVDTASEALALSISEKACVDMAYMAQLTGKSQEELIDELNGVIFLDPVRGEWQTADEYLSGNVRQKLREAEQAAQDSPGYLPNVEALRQAQPRDLDASEIEVRLGATWIDPSYIREFMWETFETPFYQQRMIDVNYSAFTAEWNIRNKNAVSYSNIAAYMTYGTERANAYKILEDTLNLRDVRIYDTKHDADGRERRVLNSKETTLAQQKQQAIRDAFRDWIWRDPDRRHTLVARYNELFNSTRPREYDGSHITFAGMNPEIRLREHQLNAVAHVLYGGNTLLAHEVGAGKTFEMVAAAMESKRLGLCHKSLFAVPNHLTEQWSGEFLRLYPSANILVATKKDFEPKNRKKFCARIATGEYDAVIIGHSQFEKIPVSMERQQRLLAEQIFEVEEGLRELKSQRAERFTIKSLERTKRGLEAKLKKLQDSSRKDDVVTFEQLGVDRLYVDEAHNYKNLFLYTKMRNVAGLSATDAQKSSDMLLKCRYIDEITDSRGVVFATGTPVSNSMTELYTMMRYLQHDAIRGKGLAHFDCWASTFGETQTAIELAPEGTGYRARTRFAKFFNLPELMTLFKEAADIKTSDQLNLPTPTPIYHNEVAQPTEIQKQMVQELSERAARVHAQLVDPGTDNMLKITSDGRKLGLDQRIINPDLPDDPNSKVNRCVDNIHRIWQDGQADRLTQLVFCDLSTPKTGATGAKAAKTAGGNLDSPELHAVERLIDKENPDEPGFTVYDDIREKLVARGIPREQIAFIHEANTETRKKELFAKVRSGQVRVLMGSTFKMGVGMNVQDRLVALHDLDCPWRPGDLEQRSGRIIRQGNRNKEVHIYRYVTESTFDAYLWQTVENKQKFISQIMTSKSPVRSCEDVDETALSYAEIKALCAGDERIKEKMDLDVDVARLKLMKASHQSQQFRLEDNLLRHFPEQIRQNESFVEGFTADMQTLAGHPHPVDGFAGMEVKGDLLTDKDNAGAAILEAFKDAKGMEPVPIGSYRGFAMSLTVEDFGRDFILTLKGKMNHRVTLGKDARGNLTRIDNALNAMPDRLQNVRNTLDALTAQMETAKAELGKPFPQEDELRTKSARLAELNAELNIDDRTPMEQMAEDAPAVQSAKAERPSVLAKLKAPLSQPCAEDKIRHRNKEER
jgi:N12 class adenine-specific DNA methylase/adenine-specific DNA methylase